MVYGRCNLINQDFLDDLEFYKKHKIGMINASPLVMGLLNNGCNPPKWHIAPKMVKEACKKAAQGTILNCAYCCILMHPDKYK